MKGLTVSEKSSLKNVCQRDPDNNNALGGFDGLHWRWISLSRRLQSVIVFRLSGSLQIVELVGYFLSSLQFLHIFFENFFAEQNFFLILRPF